MKSQGNSVASDDKLNFDSFAFFASNDRKFIISTSYFRTKLMQNGMSYKK